MSCYCTFAWVPKSCVKGIGQSVQWSGRIDIAMCWDAASRKSFAWDGSKEGRQAASTLYSPIAWFTSYRKGKKQEYTLLQLQILTGCRHQIRFHCAEIGHPIVGDTKYKSAFVDRMWAQRVFLHSYQTIFKDGNWWSAVAPLPEDLGKLLSDLNLVKVQGEVPSFWSRGHHPKLPMFKQCRESQLLQKYEMAVDLTVETVDLTVVAGLWNFQLGMLAL